MHLDESSCEYHILAKALVGVFQALVFGQPTLRLKACLSLQRGTAEEDNSKATRQIAASNGLNGTQFGILLVQRSRLSTWLLQCMDVVWCPARGRETTGQTNAGATAATQL